MIAGIRARGSRGPRGDEGIALLFVIVAMVMFSMLSLLVLGAVLSQMTPTQYQRKANQTINAAQAGLNAALASIRSATYLESGDSFGDRVKLPCWVSHPGSITSPGSSGGSAVQLAYSVSIQYFKKDPTSQSASWRAANALSCVTGIGTLTTPQFALITSAATGPALPDQPASAGNRSVQATYEMSTTNPNLPGGLIKDNNGLCYIGSAVAGTVVTLGTCSVGSDTQMWSFDSNYQIVLVSTKASDGTGGLCVAAPPPTPSSNPVTAVMKACDSSDNTQRWGIQSGEAGVYFYGHLTGSYNTSWCMGAANAGAIGSSAVADTGRCGWASIGVFPEPAVGAGGAGTTVKTPAEVDGKPLQWVNYQEFGRCLDITNWQLYDYRHIVYPCKQDPMVGQVAEASPGWNEVFTWDSSTKFFYANADSRTYVPSNPNNPAYCMQSPDRDGGYVLFSTRCSDIGATARAPYQWTVNRDTGNYATSYTIVDSYGRCLANGPPSGNPFSSAVTATCDGSDGQKWNAPAALGNATVANLQEVFPSGS